MNSHLAAISAGHEPVNFIPISWFYINFLCCIICDDISPEDLLPVHPLLRNTADISANAERVVMDLILSFRMATSYLVPSCFLKYSKIARASCWLTSWNVILVMYSAIIDLTIGSFSTISFVLRIIFIIHSGERRFVTPASGGPTTFHQIYDKRSILWRKSFRHPLPIFVNCRKCKTFYWADSLFFKGSSFVSPEDDSMSIVNVSFLEVHALIVSIATEVQSRL